MGWIDKITRIFGEETQAAPAAEPTAAAPNTYTATIFMGGQGNHIGGLYTACTLGYDLYRASHGSGTDAHDNIISCDMDANTPGTQTMSRMGEAYNTIHKQDIVRPFTAPIHVVNTCVSTNMQSGNSQISIAGAVKGNTAAEALVDSVHKPLEAARPRDEGGYGLVHIVQTWGGIILGTKDIKGEVQKIVQAYKDGRQVLVRLVGSCTGATAATLLNLMAREIYELCEGAAPQLLHNLRIHTIVLLGYAQHPADPTGTGPVLDSQEDDLRAQNFFENRIRTGVEPYIDRTYLIDAPHVIACDTFASGGAQGRRSTLGDLYALLALRDSTERDPFDGNESGYFLFAPKSDPNDPRLHWADLSDTEFVKIMVNLVRMAAFTLLKLKPNTLGVGDLEIRSAPHIKNMLGKNPAAEGLKMVIEPLKSLIALSEEVVRMAIELAATGTDWPSIQAGTAGLSGSMTTLFDAPLLVRVLEGRIAAKEVNSFELDDLTCYEVTGSKMREAFTTGQTVGDVYTEACKLLDRGDTAAQFMLAIYQALEIQ